MSRIKYDVTKGKTPGPKIKISKPMTPQPTPKNPAAVALGRARWASVPAADRSAEMARLARMPRRKKVADSRQSTLGKPV